MKNILLLLPIIILTSCKSLTGTITPKDQFKNEHTINSLPETKNQLYVKANSWMVDVFENPESVIEFTDKESGTIIGKYLLQGDYAEDLLVSIDTRIFAKIDIRVKDNTAKIIIIPTKDVKIFNTNTTKKINQQINNLITDFHSAISKKNNIW